MRNALLSLSVGLSLALAVGACTIDNSGSDASLSVDNQSDFVITELYLTDVGSSTWGRNLLAGDQLNPDETLRLDVDCGTYDAMLVDETDVSCEVNDLDLCLNDAVWVIRNDTCTAFSAAAKARAEAKAAAAAAQPAK